MTRSEFGDEIHRLITMRGISLRELARRVPVNAGQLSRVLSGKRSASPELARRCDEILDSGGALYALAISLSSTGSARDQDQGLAILREWSSSHTIDAVSDFAMRDLNVDRRQASRAILALIVGAALLEPIERHLWEDRPSAPLPRPTRSAFIDPSELDQLEATAQMFRNWDHWFGGGLRRKAVVGQLSEISDLLRDHSPRSGTETHRRLFGIMAQLSETAATMSWDVGDDPTAQRYYLLALRASREACDRGFTANILAGMARQLLYLNRPEDAQQLVRVATEQLPGQDVPPAIRSMLKTREAWAHARLGRLTAFRRATSQANEIFQDAEPGGIRTPFWITYFDRSELAGVTGGRLLELAQAHPRLTEPAAVSIQDAISLRQPGTLRSSALDHIGLTHARLLQGEFDEAAIIGHQAIDIVSSTRSHRAAVQLKELNLALTQYAVDEPPSSPVGQLRDRLRELATA